MMDGSNEAEIGKFDPVLIDWTYEFSAPKYFDFTCEETEAEVLAAEGWFRIAVPYENSRTCFCFSNPLACTIYCWVVLDMIFEVKFRNEI